jgi:hypothetical protein
MNDGKIRRKRHVFPITGEFQGVRDDFPARDAAPAASRGTHLAGDNG